MTTTTKILTEATYRIHLYLDPFNKRIRVDDYQGDVEKIVQKAEEMAESMGAEKLIIKARQEQYVSLVEKGYQCEALIDQYFLGSASYFFCKYFIEERRRTEHWMEEDQIVKNVQALEKGNVSVAPSSLYTVGIVEEKDAPKLADLYRNVFPIYPTPLHDDQYILKTMAEGTLYYGVKYEHNIICAASAEMNDFYRNAELTDCATLPEHRKHGLLKILLERLENELRNRGIFCTYSIARALSFGMNAALHQLGYSYRGRLLNNCYIFDKLENMNMWVKDLSKIQ